MSRKKETNFFHNGLPVVYSTDPADLKKMNELPIEKKKLQEQEKNKLNLSQYTVIFRIEKNQRGGKIVTVMTGFPRIEAFLKEITKEMKVKCGVGGTFEISGKDATVEIQGDQREKLKKILEEKGIKYKGM